MLLYINSPQRNLLCGACLGVAWSREDGTTIAEPENYDLLRNSDLRCLNISR